MVPDDLTMCEGCKRLTRTIYGKCGNCWYVKQPAEVPPEREYRPSMWAGVDDLADSVWLVASWSSGLVVLILGLLVDVPALIFVGAGLLALRLLGSAIFGDWFEDLW